MMNYEIFKEVVKEKFMDYMPDSFKGMELIVRPAEKVNMTYDAINIRGEDTTISPTIYINDMYEKYQSCGDLEETLMAACDLMAMEFAKTPQVVDVDSLYKDADEKVVFQLINTEQNKSFLEQVPHREFQDLSIIYKLVVNADTESIQSIKVTNSLAERLGMNEEQLFKYAAENTRRILPPRIRNMNDVMKEMFLSDGMPEEIAEMMIREVPPEQTLWIISNYRGIDGAVSMLYENELHELAENLESDLYILPSSDLGKFLQDKGIKPVLVNPYHVKQSKELDDNNPSKNDRKDPKVIAGLIKDGRFTYPYLPEGVYAELRSASNLRFQTQEELTRILNRIARWFSIYFPEYKDVYGKSDSKSGLMILEQAPLPADIRALGVDGVNKIWREAKLWGVGK